MSEREWGVLRSLDELQYLTTGQLQTLHFADHTTDGVASRVCRRVLARLAEQRVIEHLERRIGGLRAGSASFVWRVGVVGDRLLRADLEVPRRRRKEPGLRHLEHSLAVADCHVALITAARVGQLELLSRQAEPACWRRFFAAGGAPEILKPDLSCVTAVGNYEDHWFIEVDRGTESLPSLLRKCLQYERHRRSGREQAEHGLYPQVLWVVPTEAHQARLQQAIAASAELDARLFRCAIPATFLEVVAGSAS